jgi:hypothetical protein
VRRLSFLPLTLGALALAAALTGCGGSDGSDTSTVAGTAYPFAATLNTIQQVPKPKGAEGASGNFLGTITIAGPNGTLDWRLSLEGLTGGATAAQIHLGAPRKTGVVAVNLCRPCSPNARGSLGANAGLLLALVDRPTYVDVQTKRNPRGEIRGRIKVTKPVGASGGG